jgi:phosphoribosyl-ATP pyrophosphohydrolase
MNRELKFSTPRTDAIDTYIRTRNDYTKTDHQVWREHANILETELAAFKKNNQELIQRCNAAISSWDEERERALREADRVEEWKRKYEDLKDYLRFIGKQIPCNTGGTFENDPIDAILDAAVRALNAERLKKKYGDEANERTLESLIYNVERTKVFEEIADMLYKSEYDQRDAAKKIYEIVREKYPIGTYCPDAQKNKIYENKL